jgi:hypothetical protein
LVQAAPEARPVVVPPVVVPPVVVPPVVAVQVTVPKPLIAGAHLLIALLHTRLPGQQSVALQVFPAPFASPEAVVAHALL